MTNTTARLGAGVAALLLQATAAPAQIRPYAVAEAGVERRQTLADGQAPSTLPDAAERNGREDGFAYGLAIGAEAPIAGALFAGLEAGLSRSEVETEAVRFRGIEAVESVFIGVFDQIRVDPRWSYSATGRLGANLSGSVAVYGLAGYGGERVRIRVASATELVEGVPNAAVVRTKRSYDGVTYGGGARLLLSDRVGVRVEYRRLETDDGYDPERVAAGLLYRF